MKLLYSPTSPYARKVLVLAHEAGIGLEVEAGSGSPTARNPKVAAQNPLGKIPVLLSDQGPLYDSRVICQYLDTLHQGRRLYPEGAARFVALRREALADGLLDAALLARYETTRPEEKVWSDWYDGQVTKMKAALDQMETDLPDAVDIGAIAYGCALGYVDFRFAALNWRDSHPLLAAWEAEFAARPSMQATRIPE